MYCRLQPYVLQAAAVCTVGILAALMHQEGGEGGEQSEPAVLLARVSGAFAARIPFFKLYAEYCGNYVYAARELASP